MRFKGPHLRREPRVSEPGLSPEPPAPRPGSRCPEANAKPHPRGAGHHARDCPANHRASASSRSQAHEKGHPGCGSTGTERSDVPRGDNPTGNTLRPLGERECALRAPRMEEVRVTTDAEHYEKHAESVELWSRGNPLFNGPKVTSTTAKFRSGGTLGTFLNLLP